jgi:hypothetical protein
MKPLPLQFQMAPIFSMVAGDFNEDGNLDIISGGNLTATRARTGRLTGNYGVVAYGDGKGNFTSLSNSQSGLCIKGDVRHMVIENNSLIVAVNNSYILQYKLQSSKLKQ